MSDLKSLVSQHLSLHLGFEAQDVTDYILSMPTPESVRDYMEELIGSQRTPENDLFHRKLASLWPKKTNLPKSQGSNSNTHSQQQSQQQNQQQNQRQNQQQKQDRKSTQSTTEKSQPKQNPQNRQQNPSSQTPRTKQIPLARENVDIFPKAKPKAHEAKQPSTATPQKIVDEKQNGENKHAITEKSKESAVPESTSIVFLDDGKDKKSSATPKLQKESQPNTSAADYRYQLKQKVIKQSIHKSFLLPGRHFCDCQATKHDLIANCLRCGKIVCSQEGIGPCSYCGAFVGGKRSRAPIQAEPSEQKDSAPKTDGDEHLAKALQHRDRLLHFDQTSAQRTVVYDDQADYYQVDVHHWMTPEEREAALKKNDEERAKRHDASRKMLVTFDIAGRKVIVEDEKQDAEPASGNASAQHATPSSLQPLPSSSSTPANTPIVSKRTEQSTGVFRNPTLDSMAPVFFLPPKQTPRSSTTTEPKPEPKSAPIQPVTCGVNRLQTNMNPFDDQEVDDLIESTRGLEIVSGKHVSDKGLCLSMHQPWASLLVYGIKKVEGRNWYHDHRGPLWIASASHKPTPEEIKAVESQCKAPESAFPKMYPTSMLLGRVIVEDCIDRDEYMRRFKEDEREENSSNYLFISSSFARLRVPIPVTGQHKIWHLDPRTLKMAQDQDLIKSA